MCRECACAGVRPIGLATRKPEVHARLSGRHVALWVGRQNAVLAVGRNALMPGMHLCRGKTDWPCGVQTVSSRAAQWSGMWPSGLAGKMLCWPLAAMRLYRGKTDWPCDAQTGSSRAAQWAACGPLRLPVMMLCWPLSAMCLCRDKAGWPCGMQTGSSRTAQSSSTPRGSSPAACARLSARYVAAASKRASCAAAPAPKVCAANAAISGSVRP